MNPWCYSEADVSAIIARAEAAEARVAALEGDQTWQRIETAPYHRAVDVWCVYGGEEFSQYDGGASIGKMMPDRFRHSQYEWFGNQSANGIPCDGAADLVPVAWRYAVPRCPPEIISAVLGIPVLRENVLP